MPRLNRRGQALSGMGIVSIGDGPNQPPHVVGPGNHAVWLDDDRAIYGATNGDQWSVWVYDQRIGQPEVLDPRTHDFLAGGGGAWGAVGPGGFFGSLPLPATARLSLAETDSRGASSPDGTLAISDPSGLGFDLIAPSGEVTAGSPGRPAYGLTVAGPRHAIWPDGGRLVTLNLPTPVHVGPSGRACWCDVPGRGVWLVHYLAERGLVVRELGSSRGRVIEAQGIFNHYDAIAWQGGVRVCYSTTVGEAPDQLIVRDIDVTAGLEDLAGVTPAPPPPPPQGDDVMIRAFEHTFWLAGFYEVGEHQGDTPEPYRQGNACVLVEKEGDQGVLQRDLARFAQGSAPLIVQGDAPLPEAARNLTVAYWASGGTPDQLGASVGRALTQAWRVPVVAYLDGDGWPDSRPAWMTDDVRPSVQAYPRQGETPQSFAARVEPIIQRVRAYGLPWCLTPRLDGPDPSATWRTVELIESLLPLYEHWIRAYQPAYVMLFAAMRGAGYERLRQVGDTRLYRWARALAYAVPCGRPGRYDHVAAPSRTSRLAVLRNKLRQSRSLKTVEDWLARDLEAGMAVHYGEPEPDPGGPPPPPPPDGDYPPELEDQRETVARLRRSLFPDRYQPGHPDANDEGYLPLHDPERAAQWAWAVARALKQYGVGVVRAKPGSANHGGATPEIPEGITTDIVALANGVHWDFQADGHEGAAWPKWSLVPRINDEGGDNWAAVAPRWVRVS